MSDRHPTKYAFARFIAIESVVCSVDCFILDNKLPFLHTKRCKMQLLMVRHHNII